MLMEGGVFLRIWTISERLFLRAISAAVSPWGAIQRTFKDGFNQSLNPRLNPQAENVSLNVSNQLPVHPDSELETF